MTLAQAQASVSPELKQQVELISDSIQPHELYLFTDRQGTEPTVKFLLYPSGLPTPYRVLYSENELVIANRTETVSNYNFPIGTEIVSVEYLQTREGHFGMAVLYNDGDKGYLARLVENGASLKLVNETVIPYPGTCMKVVIDDVEMHHNIAKLAKAMQKWVNIVVVGTSYGHAYVFSVPIIKTWGPKDMPQERNLTDALASYHKERDTQGRSTRFVYRSDTEGRPDVIKIPRDVYVSSFAYIPRSCDLLIGLSFGGIVQVGFTVSGDIANNVFQSSSPVRYIIPMLPHDDPNMNVWFWALHGERGKGLNMVLYEGSYRVIGQENVPLRDRDFNKALFFPRMMEQLSPKGTTADWICAHTLTRERRSDDIGRDEETCHNSTLNDSDIDLSQLFFCYKDINCLKFGLFDLNTYYYKRLQDQPRPDNTLARQCAYMTNVVGPSLASVDKIGIITDMLVDCNCITKFQFMEDAEQDIYVSGVNLMAIYVGAVKAKATLKLQSLPSRVLENLYADISVFIRKPREATMRLLAVGLMSPSSMEQSRHVEYELLMTAAILYGYTDSVVNMISETPETEWTELRTINEWMWSEVLKARNKLDALNDVLFTDTAKALSADQKRQLQQVNLILKAAITVYQTVLHKYKSWEQLDFLPRELIAEHEVRLAAVRNLSDFANCIINLYHLKYLPLMERDAEERHILENSVLERRNALSTLNQPRTLFVDNIIANMQRISPDEAFWLDQRGRDWYPPALHNGVASLLVMAYQQKMKQQFIIYYVTDLVMARKRLTTTRPKPGFVGILVYIKEILQDVLNITTAEILPVLNIWYEEQQVVLGLNHHDEPIANDSFVLDVLENKIKSLVDKPCSLSDEEEKELKRLLAQIPYGQFRYQLYLLERSRFAEIEILPIPKDVEDRYVNLYTLALPGINRLKRQLNSFNLGNQGPKWPDDVVQKIRSFDSSQQQKIKASENTARTPIPIFKRLKKIAQEDEAKDTTQEKMDMVTTPDPKKNEDTLESTPKMEMDEKLKEKVNSILRTPTSRRARAAAAAEGQTGVQVTPECQPSLPAPTSILKASTRSNHMSPSRGIRWDPEFVDPSLNSSSLSVDSLQQEKVPHFHLSTDESVLTEDDNVEKPIEVQPADEDNVEQDDIVEKSFEVQQVDEDTVERSVEVHSEDDDEADEKTLQNENTIEIQEDDVDIIAHEIEETYTVETAETDKVDTLKLVDYSLTESTFCETPKRKVVTSRLSRRWVDADGTEHSFEQQEDVEMIEDKQRQDVDAEDILADAAINEVAPSVSGTREDEIAKTERIPSPPKASNIPEGAITTSSSSEIEVTNSEDDDYTITSNKYKRKPPLLPVRANRMKSEEPNKVKPPRGRRSISESLDVSPPVAEPRRSTRLSASRDQLMEKPKPAQRALVFTRKTPTRDVEKLATDQLPPKETTPARRSRTPSIRSRTPSTRSKTPSTRSKTPSTRSRTPSVSGAVTAEPKTSITRSRSRSKRNSPDVHDNAAVEKNEPRSPSRKRVIKPSEAVATTSEEDLPRFRSRSSSAVRKETPSRARTPTRSSSKTVEIEENEPITPRRSGRAPKVEVKAAEPSAVSVFKAKLAEKKKAPSRKRAGSEPSNVPALKKISKIPAIPQEIPTIPEEEEVKTPRRGGRIRTQSQNYTMEKPMETVKKSPSRRIKSVSTSEEPMDVVKKSPGRPRKSVTTSAAFKKNI